MSVCVLLCVLLLFFFSSRRRHTMWPRDWSSDVCSSDLTAVHTVRRGGTISLSGVYGGQADPIPMLTLFDKQVTLRMGQANVRRWVDDLMPLVSDPAEPLGVLDLRTHRLPLTEASQAYEMFQKKQDGCIKVVFEPGE